MPSFLYMTFIWLVTFDFVSKVIQTYSGSSKAIQKNKIASPTWITTTVYTAPDAANFLAKICTLYRWTTLFFVHDKESSFLFYAAATAFNERFSDPAAHYQLTRTQVNVASAVERVDVLKWFSTAGRGISRKLEAHLVSLSVRWYSRRHLTVCCVFFINSTKVLFFIGHGDAFRKLMVSRVI